MKMHTLIEAAEGALAEDQPLMQQALAQYLDGKRAPVAADPEAVADAWERVAMAAKAMARIAGQGRMDGGSQTRRLIALMVKDLADALAETGALEGAVRGGPLSQVPPPAWA
jgi:hypothetical protein